MSEGYTAAKAELGDWIRSRMTGRTVEDVAQACGWSVRSMHRALNGHVRPQELRMKALVRTLTSDPAEQARGMSLWKAAEASDIEEAADLSATYRRLRECEAVAVHTCVVETKYFPGLTQHPKYTRLLAAGTPFGKDPGWIARAVREREDRRKVFDRPGYRYSVLLDESVVWRTLGDLEVWGEQLSQAETMFAGNPLFTLRIIPRTVPASGLLGATTTTIFRMPRNKAPRVFMDGYPGIQELTKPRDLDWVTREWANLTAFALTEEDSLKYIRNAYDEVS
ncbi:DUF5753 domain-containing protein [Saccharothrix sp. HUAS TT1]|uniref:DUF5753 domain-containing protein n=1 Tax=unclassified Saccharothrix TaxID=2593673 RepID=UPI00345BD165